MKFDEQAQVVGQVAAALMRARDRKVRAERELANATHRFDDATRQLTSLEELMTEHTAALKDAAKE